MSSPDIDALVDAGRLSGYTAGLADAVRIVKECADAHTALRVTLRLRDKVTEALKRGKVEDADQR